MTSNNNESAEVVIPTYMTHANTKNNKTPIFSIHVHPDGSRVATAGQDFKIKIWNMKPIRDSSLINDPTVPKLLSVLSAHSGAVLCNRWSNDGKYIASGGEDRRIVIWKQTTSKISFNSAFGSKNVENWTQHAILPGHNQDVLHLEWSPDNKYLASCGLDAAIIIWDALTFKVVKKITQHSDFVKGIAWDPVGKFLCSQSNDKTLKIWRTYDWTLEKTINAPFEKSPLDTFYSRPSWSPDGESILAPNAMKTQCPVVATIKRSDFSSDTSIVADFETCACASYSPTIFKTDKTSNDSYLLCATGSVMGTFTIWSSGSSRPIAGFRNGFKHEIHDISWTPDGLCALACSYDGTVKAILLNKNIFGFQLTVEDTMSVLKKFGNKRYMEIPESLEQLELETKKVKISTSSCIPSEPGQKLDLPLNSIASINIDKINTVNVRPKLQNALQKVEIRGDGKKRIQPVLLNSIDEQSTATSFGSVQSTGKPYDDLLSENSIAAVAIEFSKGSNVGGNSRKAFAASNNFSHEALNTETPIYSIKSEVFNIDVVSGCTGMSKVSEDRVILRDLIYVLPTIKTNAGKASTILSIPSVQSSIGCTAYIPGTYPNLSNLDSFDHVENPHFHKEPTKKTTTGVAVIDIESRLLNTNEKHTAFFSCKNVGTFCISSLQLGGVILWRDKIENASATIVKASSKFIALATADGALIVYSIYGRKLFPSLQLDGPAVYLVASSSNLMAITSNAKLYAWDIESRRKIVCSNDILHILDGRELTINDDVDTNNKAVDNFMTVKSLSKDDRAGIKELEKDDEQTSERYHNVKRDIGQEKELKIVNAFFKGRKPVIVSSKYETFVFDTDGMEIWMKVGDRSEALMDVAGRIQQDVSYAERQLNTSLVLGDAKGYREWMHLYIRRLTDEGDAARITEFLDNLLGKVSRPDESQEMHVSNLEEKNYTYPWVSTVLGLSKHQLLRELLPIVSQNKALQRLVAQFAEGLRIASKERSLKTLNV